MSVNHAKEFLKYVLYLQTFLLELQMAASIPILGINIGAGTPEYILFTNLGVTT